MKNKCAVIELCGLWTLSTDFLPSAISHTAKRGVIKAHLKTVSGSDSVVLGTEIHSPHPLPVLPLKVHPLRQLATTQV